MIERTLCIIKPDAVSKNISGLIINDIENAGFKIVAQKMLKLTKIQAESFYAEHFGKEFYEPLVNFMLTNNIIVMILEKENAINDYRKLMGATLLEKREEGTIRKKYSTSTRENCVHGSDSLETAKREISFFFSEIELIK
jgi:nucleoside-diphosphate kinase